VTFRDSKRVQRLVPTRDVAVQDPLLGIEAPEALLLDPHGSELALSSLWREGPLILTFLRYFGCPFCQAQVGALRRDQLRFDKEGVRVALIGQGSVEQARSFSGRHHVPFPLLLDPRGLAFHAFGLVAGSLRQLFAPSVGVSFLAKQLDPETRQRGLQGGSFRQMPGTFVIDGAGIVRFTHRSRTIAEGPSNETLLRVIRELAARDAIVDRPRPCN
jgi:peroxiredoxin